MTYWLEGGVIPLHGGADNGFLQEVDRVVELLGADEQWLAWWRGHSKAPRLEVQLFVLKKPRTVEGRSALAYAGADEGVVRGRKRHVVRLQVDFATLEPLEPDERRMRALPAVLEGVGRACEAFDLPEPPPAPAEVQPAPLREGVLRRRRLRELLDARSGRGDEGS